VTTQPKQLPGDKQPLARRGFTLIEMMAVVAVIAILALIALPSFMDKIARDQIVEALPLADLATRPVAANWAATKTLLADNTAAELPEPNKIVSNWVSSVTLQNGAVHIVFGNRASGAIKGKTLTLRPAVVEDEPVVPVSWVCGSASTPERMVVKGVNRTNIPIAFLPMRCR
jgi:type IV pilus assembly protein PilA